MSDEPVGRVRGMMLSNDGKGYSIPKVFRVVGGAVVTGMTLVVFLGIGWLGWKWGNWQGFMIFAASTLVGGGILDNTSHRWTHKPEAEE